MSEGGGFQRIVKLDRLPVGEVTLTANAEECAALARRFDLPAIKSLCATISLAGEGRDVTIAGKLSAEIEQNCAVSGEPFPNRIDESVMFRFVPADNSKRASTPDEEIELDSSELDEIEYEGGAFDLGEAIAQSLVLAIDPYATGPDAENVRKAGGLLGSDELRGPFAALAGLKDKSPKPKN